MMEEVGEERPWFEKRPRIPDLDCWRGVCVEERAGGTCVGQWWHGQGWGWGLQAEPPRIRAGGRIYLFT
jgi:hypothetical protein